MTTIDDVAQAIINEMTAYKFEYEIINYKFEHGIINNKNIRELPIKTNIRHVTIILQDKTRCTRHIMEDKYHTKLTYENFYIVVKNEDIKGIEFYEKLTELNYLNYCMKHYDNIQCQMIEEFEEDLNRIVYLKRLLSRYHDSADLKERLILNHLIVLFNLFNDATLNILFFKLDKQYWNYLITFLIYLNRMPDEIPQHGIITSDYSLDENIIAILRKL
mgnify:CR=1 FL=1